MLFSLNWLKDYVDLPEVSTISERLTRAGSEVERVLQQEVDFEGVVVARVEALRPHPNADKLQLARVSTGSTAVEVVTGATNLTVGDLVPLATSGARLKARRIGSQVFRGIRSEGMLCSAIELGLGSDADGILILDRGLVPGEDLKRLFPTDTVLEVEIKSNRPDLLCHLGLARELSALFKEPLRLPGERGHAEASQDPDLVLIEAPDACRRFIARRLTGVRVGPSPSWMQARLRVAGVRPISNVVDITNYVMLEAGQPMHAFDLHALRDQHLVVRMARKGESLACLDGKVRSLTELDMVVADGEKPQGLAGIIGGTESAVETQTTEIILEAATWDQRRVRASARRFGLRTEASARFEKGLSPALGPPAIERATALLSELAGGRPVASTDLYRDPLVAVEIDLSSARVEGVLGVAVPIGESADILERLSFTVRSDDDRLSAVPPDFRLDCTIPEDLIEEIGRIHGYDRVPSTLPGRRIAVRDLYRRDDLDERAREILAGEGLDEAVSNTLVSAENPVDLRMPLAPARGLSLENPMAENRNSLRTSLLPGLLEALALNTRQDQPGVRLFELGPVFWPGKETVEEARCLGIAVHVAGGAEAALAALRDLQQTILLLRNRLAFSGADFQPAEAPGMHPGRTASVLVEGAVCGMVGEVHPGVLSVLGISGRAVGAEILFDRFSDGVTADPQAQTLPRFPGIRRDLTVVVHGHISAADLVQVIRRHGGYTLRDIYMLNEFRGAQLGEGARSLSFRLHYQADDRTLTNEEVAASHQRITEGLKEINAEVRG